MCIFDFAFKDLMIFVFVFALFGFSGFLFVFVCVFFGFVLIIVTIFDSTESKTVDQLSNMVLQKIDPILLKKTLHGDKMVSIYIWNKLVLDN